MKNFACLVLWVGALATTYGQGTVEAVVNYSNSPTAGYISGTAGWSFTPQITIQLTDLGCLDTVLTANGPVDIGLWTDTGSLLKSAVIDPTNQLVDVSRYVAVAPLLLSAGTTYRVGVYSPSGSIFMDPVGPGYGGSVTLSPQVNLGALAIGAGGFVFPNSSGGNGTMLLGANFLYNPIPEPAVPALLAAAGVLTALRRRRR